MTDEKFFEKAKSFLVMKEASSNSSIGGEKEGEKYFTMEEYKYAAETLQKNKDGKTVVLYTTDAVQQDAYIKAAKAKGFRVTTNTTTFEGTDPQEVQKLFDLLESLGIDGNGSFITVIPCSRSMSP